MKRLRLAVYLWLLAAPLLLLAQGPQPVVVLNVTGAIGPATSDYIARGLKKAQERNAELVVLRMDTPGGLDLAMRSIIQDIIASPIPIATYVAPSGARAASAGTYILYASHIAAMAPGTNLGAATPVQIGGPGGPSPQPGDEQGKDDKERQAPAADAMTKKQVNDAIAYIRSLAQLRGRNAEWAEKAVREAASLPAEQAVKQNVADFIANDLQALIAKANGRKVNVLGQDRVLHTAGASVETIEPDWRNKLLAVITDPNVAYILMLLGIYGLFFELWNPGFVLPGVIGAISLLLALYAFQVLPISYAGMGLILLGIAFMTAEALVPSFGILGFGGIVAFVIGSIILIDVDAPGYGIALPLIVGVAVVSAAFFITVITMALKARRRPVVSGREQMIGMTAVANAAFANEGYVRIHGEDWLARTSTPVEQGQRVRVVSMDGLTLVVAPEQENQGERTT